MKAAPLRERLYRSLGPRARMLRKLVRIAVDLGAPPYLVGGPVRDLLARRAVLDLDVLLPERLGPIARAGAEALGGRTILRRHFLTATIATPQSRIDLSRARRERYSRPGALPVVAPGTIEQDLRRRDFTVNAMALPLHADAGDELLDPFGGRADLRARRLAALHPRSFVDDPTRLFRALRYAARFDLRVEPSTARWLRAAVDGGALDTVSGDRIRHEIERLLDEAKPGRAASRTARWGLLEATAPGWSLGRGVGELLDRLSGSRTRPPWPEAADPEVRRAAGLRALLLGSRPDARPAILARIAIGGRPAREIADDLERLGGLRRSLARTRGPAAVVSLLEPLGEPALLLLHCTGGTEVAAAVRRYARRYRHVRAPFDGHAARRFGASGPQIGALLRAARFRALEGRKADERWARHWLARRGP